MKMLFFEFFGLLDIILLCSVYFSKKRINNYENKIYKFIVISNLLGQILHICCFFSIDNAENIPILNIITCKSYLIYLITWLLLLVIYIFTIIYTNEQRTYEENKKTFSKIINCFVLLLLLAIIIIIIAPTYFNNDANGIYTYGFSVDFVYIASMVCLMVCFPSMIFNLKKIKSKKCLPLFAYILLGTIVMIIQKMSPDLLLITTTETFITLLMFFTIENPDMKMIEQLNIARDQADKANNAKSEFLSSMSHEIRTPLNAIVGFSQALLEEDIPESVQEEVNDIMMASDSLLEIVNGILDISKIEANKLEIIDTEYELNKTLKELVSLTKTRIGEKPIEFRSNIDPSIPEVLYGDHTRLKQVILNLLTNAAKYTNEGYIEFKISSVIKNDICRLIITVEDTGIGIKKEKINNLFTKFDRLEVEKQTTIEGTGLGLAITKKLVELMNGKIVVQSVYGKGSKFTVAIDQKIVANKKIEKQEEVKEASLDLTGKKLLVVDDNKVNLKVAERLLKSYNVTVKTLSSGIDAIDTIKNGEVFDLILMDDMMPKMSGTETMHHLKELEGFNIPVVALTANAISGMKEKYLSEGFDDYLSKPIQKPELNEVLAKYLK